MKSIYEKLTNITMVKDKVSASKINKATMSALHTSTQHCTRGSSQGNWARKKRMKEIKGIQIREEVQVFANDMILFLENPKESI